MSRLIRSRRGQRDRSRGQSLAEFALVAPILLLIVLLAIDFGRLFFAYVAITNAARVGANYAAVHPDDTYPNATYTALVTNDGASALGTTCATLGTFDPTFLDGSDTGTTPKDLGDSARVVLSCQFRVMTPVISRIIGQNVTIRASAIFPIRTGPSQ